MIIDSLLDDILSKANYAGTYHSRSATFSSVGSSSPCEPQWTNDKAHLLSLDTRDIAPAPNETAVLTASPEDSRSSSSSTSPWQHALDSETIVIPSAEGDLQCLFHKSRPQHATGYPDQLPFEDAETLRSTFKALNLPTTYIHIADGIPGVVQTMVSSGRCDFIAHHLSKQCDWALAIRHTHASSGVSAFWSLDQRVDTAPLVAKLHAFHDFVFHPMLLPCIMFAHTLQMAIERRNNIKRRLKHIQEAIKLFQQRAARHFAEQDGRPLDWWTEHAEELESLFQTLQECKRDQASCQGRFHFWNTFHTAIDQGFAYMQDYLISQGRQDLISASQDLRVWSELTWQKLDSIDKRNIDHVAQVADAVDMLHHVLQQREAQIQCSIARAALRDSGDMKFIAMLGSVFLPAGLIASLMNIPQFQLVSDMKLLLVYIGTTVPLVCAVVVLCMTRSRWTRWLNACRPSMRTGV